MEAYRRALGAMLGIGASLVLSGCGLRSSGPPAPPPQRALESAGKLQEETHVHRTPGRTESQTRQVPVTRMVTHYEYRCRSVPRTVSRSETVYEYRYDYTTKSSRSVPTTRYVTKTEYHNECKNEPVMRSETTYESKTETRYVPPQEHVTRTYDKDTVLVEVEPEVLVSPHHFVRK